MCGGGSISTYILDCVESKAFRLINAPNLPSQLPSLKWRRDIASLSIFYKYHFGRCSEELSYCVPGSKNAMLDSILLRMNFECKLATLASMEFVLASFPTQETCGTLYPLQFFLLPTVYLHLNVECTGTLEALIDFFLLLTFSQIVF